MFMVLSYCLLGVVAGLLVVTFGFSAAWWEPMRLRPFGLADLKNFLAASLFLGSTFAYAAAAVPRAAALVAWLVTVGLVLALIDWTRHLLPHHVVGTLFAGGLVQIIFMTLVLRDVEPLLRAGTAAAVVFAVGLLLYLRLGADLGFGDITLATTLALFLGWCGWSYVASGLLAGLLIAGVVARTLLLLRRIRRHDPVALGPALLAGALYAMLQA